MAKKMYTKKVHPVERRRKDSNGIRQWRLLDQINIDESFDRKFEAGRTDS